LKIHYSPTPEKVRSDRKIEYLKRYPVEAQLEALTEASMGKTKKLEELLRGLSEIREAIPFADEVIK